MSAKIDEWLDPTKGDVLERVAKLVGLSLDEWLAKEPCLPQWPEYMQLLLDLIGGSARSPTVILFFDDVVVLRHDGHLSASMSMMRARVTGERLKSKNEVVDPSASLTCEELRSVFVMLEALVYKIVHLRLERQRVNYSQRSETYDLRLDRLASEGLIGAEVRNLALLLYETRNQFAHSLLPVEKISYRNEPLRDRWGANSVSGQRQFKRYFLPDAFELSDALLALFRPIQGQQLDLTSFRATLRELV